MAFGNPSALLFSILLAGLILLYLWERRQRRVDVPSMLLWEVVPEAVIRRHRFQPDSLFWLQLAALTMLILGLADPYFDTGAGIAPPRRVILVLDLSASMQTNENGGSRLDLAREAALRVIHAAPADSEIMLVGAAREPSIVVPFGRDRVEMIELLSRLRAKDVAIQLEPALAMAQRFASAAPGDTAIHVFTDTLRADVGETWRAGTHWWPTGSRGDNLAIVDVQTNQGVLQASRRTAARVSVRNFGRTEMHGALAVSVSGDTIAHELFTAPPADVTSFHIPAIDSSGLMEITLRADDALALDNSWRTWLPPFRSIRIGLVGAGPDLAASMARFDAASTALTVGDLPDSPTPAELADFDVIVFHRVVPAILPDAPTLWIAPDLDIETQRALPDLPDASVIDWSDHRVLRGIQPQLLGRLTAVKRMTPPPWGEVVVSALSEAAAGSEVPLLVVGQRGGHRAAILAADLGSVPFLASDREPLLLLLANLIDWLDDRQAAVEVVRTGDSRTLDGSHASPVSVVDPRGDVADVDDEAPVLDFDLAGIYRIRRDDGGETTIVANFTDATESDVGRPASAPHEAAPVDRPRYARGADDGVGAWLYAVAASLLLAEWLFAARTEAHG